jgi:hypothetical protein
VAYLSTDLGVLASYFYFVAHTAYYCMSVIRLSGNVWIICLYASISVSYESMIGYTVDLGKCLYDTELSTCYTHIYMKVSHVWVVPSCSDDAVNRTMVRVVLLLYTYLEMHVERVDYFTAFMHNIHTVRVWAEMILARYITTLSCSTY